MAGAMKTCAYAGCPRNHHALGYCHVHYKRLRRGSPMASPLPIDRLLACVVVDNSGCWSWTRSTQTNGYASFSVADRTVSAHRFSYEYFRGPIPDGLVIDHLCRNRACVNPDHLEPVTQRENWLRGVSHHAIVALTNICCHGHSLDGAYLDSRGKRSCRICVRDRARERYRRVNGVPSGAWRVRP